MVKKKVKRVKKGQSCGNGFERVTVKYGKRTIRACIRTEGEYKKAKAHKYRWWEKVLDAVSGMSP